MSAQQVLANSQRRQALMAMAGLALPLSGAISSYNPGAFQVKVVLQPDGQETGWLPLATPWVGSGWGMFCAPNIGDMVDVQFIEGHQGAGFASLRFFNEQDQPLSVAAGEFWLVHASGSFLKLTNDGKLALNGDVEIDVATPTINITCTSAVNVTAPEINLGAQGGALQALVNAELVSLFNSHTHPYDDNGTPATTAVPTSPLTNSVLTKNLKAS